jgi:hypothetical protein
MFSPREKLLSRYRGPVIRKILVQNAFQVSARSPFEIQLMLLQKAQTGPNDFGLVVEAPGSNEVINHLLKMRRYDFAHSKDDYNSYEQLSMLGVSTDILRRWLGFPISSAAFTFFTFFLPVLCPHAIL